MLKQVPQEYTKKRILCKRCYYNSMIKKVSMWVVLVVVSVWATVLRVYGITQQSYWIDESYSITLAKAIVQHCYPLLDSGAVIWRASVYHYILAGITSIFEEGYLATRIFSIIIGVLTIFLIAYLAKVWFSKSAAVVTLMLMTFSYWEIAWSRQARMYMVFQFCFWLTLFLFERWQRQRVHWIWPTLLAMITISIHQLGWVLIGCMAIWMVIQRYKRKPVHLLPLVIPFTMVIVGCVSSVALVSYLSTDIGLVNYWNHYIHFLWREHSLVLVISLITICISLYKKSNTIVLWLSGVFLLSLGVISYSVPLLEYRYLFFVLPVLYLLTAYSISLIPKLYIQIVVVVLIIVSSSFVIIPRTYYPLESDEPTSRFNYKSITPQPNFESTYGVIAEYNPEVLITPYPTISRLYGMQDTAAIYVDLTGTISQAATMELYTGVPFIDIDKLSSLTEQGQTGVIMIDFFAEQRMDADLRAYIETHFQEVYTNTSGAYSRVTLYSF